MKANELRIGNYYKWYAEGNEYIYQVDAKDFTSDNIKNFDPIPLTEEWLLKFGFKSNPYNDTYYLENIYFEGCKLVFECNKTRGFTELWSDKFPLVEYVHQLQNLYFALTGEELTQVSEGKNKNFV